MGFNKRYINEKIIRTIIKEDGLHTLINFIKKSDALIIEDEFSIEICSIIQNTYDNKVLNSLLEKTDLYGKKEE